jgi:ribosome-associated protein
VRGAPGSKRTPLAAPKRTASLGETSPGGRARKSKSHGGGASESIASDAARDLAIVIAVAGLEKKAVGLEILDVSGKVDYADFLVVMTGRSDRQVSALAQGIEAALLLKGKRALSVEGMPHASWVLMDFGDVVVHVFQDEARSLYDIEGLWMDAKRIPVPDSENEAR